MKLSTRTRYGVRMMLALAVNDKKGPVFLKDIARSEDISEKYLSQIIIPLKAKGLLAAFRGAHGGYVLGRPASEIRLREIVEPLEGDLRLVECVRDAASCERAAECVTHEVWSGLGALLLSYLDSLTLGELVERYRKMNAGKGNPDFSI